ALNENLAASPDLQLQRLGKRIHDGNADSVQPARDFVGVIIEFTAGVQFGQDYFGCGLAFLVHLGGDAATIVDHRNRTVDVDDDVDLSAVSGQRLVDRVVHDLVHEMMQPIDPR